MAILVGCLGLLLIVSAAVRLTAIDREPFWLDEILAHDHTSGTLTETLETVSHNVHPPLFYLGLKTWRSALGDSVAALRGYSTAWSLVGVLVVALLARDLAGRWSAGLAGALLAAVNPLDVYFAQEARMYAQAAALAALSSWFLLRYLRTADHSPRSERAWPWGVAYWLAGTALLLTHYISLAILLVQAAFALVTLGHRKAWRSLAGYLVCATGWLAALLPWLLLVRQSRGLRLSMVSWVPAPTLAEPFLLVTRDLFWGRAHLPQLAWHFATALSALLLAAGAVSLAEARRRAGSVNPPAAFQPRPVELAYVGWLVVGPVTLLMIVSAIARPALYRPRFCLLVLPPLLALLAVAIDRGRPHALRLGILVATLAIMGFATTSQHRALDKTGLVEFAALWHEVGPPDDVLFYPRWNRRVAGFYLGEPVLNVPKREQLEKNLRRGSPRRVWVVRRVGNTMAGEPQEERELLEWVFSLGPQHRLALVDDVEVTEIRAQPLPQLFPPLTPGVPLRFDQPSSDPYLPDGWYRAEKGFRWSRGNRAEVLFALEPPAASELRLEMFCFRRQRITVTFNGQVLNPFECAERAPHLRTIALPPGLAQQENRLLFDLPDATSPLAVGESGDRRTLALGVCSLTVE